MPPVPVPATCIGYVDTEAGGNDVNTVTVVEAYRPGEEATVADDTGGHPPLQAPPVGSNTSLGSQVETSSSQRAAWLAGPTVRQSASRLAGLEANQPQHVTRMELIENGMSAFEADARMVRQHENEVLQAHFMRWVLCSFVVWTMIMAIGLALQVWVIVEYCFSDQKECAVPLYTFVRVTLVLWVIRLFSSCVIDRCICCWNPDPEAQEPPPCRVMCKNMLLALFDFVWVIVLGLHWIVSDGPDGDLPACESLSPDLFAAVKGYVSFHLASLAYVWLNIIGLRQMLTMLMRRGLLRTSNAAPPGAFEKNTQNVKVSEIDIEENPSCPICMEDYSDAVEICKTSACGHVFHKQCLKNWLQTARSCPICRNDLGELGGGSAGEHRCS
mmetsp:Transcript_14904/g.32181  ORF Transcript_14904/g.32181 Transcript_14904/m.32181 type:complete len:385 (-) Transcript_14904:219-1373(-)|eukprot:CAMPEP_0206585988 /NCGR_PEP_ID=MMETSP0325_2-20121206/36747_1 /ASSEMBLY_ACC=CAM_ASM_000347 /TAXON_ID=2866 /ORGANISM="Crypthecodinium cohnii, Strain Seligo" /LENGTH=384 /DNA_ID=CAMNT_0054093645 /DNA_START=17 /DNA_END=1171 /DNA_ORIENTATION=+